MKKLLLLACSVGLIISSSYAQPKKGDWLLGAQVAPISIKGGYFLSDKWVIGTELRPNFLTSQMRI